MVAQGTMDVLDSLTTELANRKKNAAAEYQQICRRIADNESPTLEAIEAALLAAGKAPDDLRGDVATYRGRVADAALLAELPALEAERGELEGRIATAATAVEGAKKRYQEITMPLQMRIADIDGVRVSEGAAKERLVKTCTDPELLGEANRISNELGELAGRVEPLRADLRRFQGPAGVNDEGTPLSADSGDRDPENRAAARRYDARARSTLAAVERKIGALQVAGAANRERMLQP